MTKSPNADLRPDLPEETGHKQLDSHVQAPPPVYGEPKGPRPATMFRHEVATPMPPDRERNGFIGGRAEVGLGDIVGSGPEEWERESHDLSGEDRNKPAQNPDDPNAND